ncbi:MAG: biopolymer transporter ExbD [Planctomycetes bacterium]|nr:biopolymer transporter ExbD [Planctomycetota bacterium]
MARRKAPTVDDTIAQLNMTPMIDVTFQLLIFFMVGMQIRVPEGILRAYLPKDRGTGGRPKDDQVPPPELRIRLERDQASVPGNVKVNIFFEQYQCESIADLESKLLRLGAEMSTIPVVIDGRSDVPFRYILGALNACVKAKFTEISFKAPPPEAAVPR